MEYMISSLERWEKIMLKSFQFSVLISVYKSEVYSNFNESLLSIYDNQILKPTEIILVKDGPLNSDLDFAIKLWQEKLPEILKVYELEVNSGLATALNFGLIRCTHDIVARMDSDDISLPNRFNEQIEFMYSNPSISVLSSCIEEFDTEMINSIGYRKLPLTHNDIYKFAKRRNPISHPVSVFKKVDVLNVGGYPIFDKAQDYALWSLMLMKGYRFSNLKQVHLKMRTGNALMNRRGLRYLKNEYKILKYQKSIGFLNTYEYLFNLFTRTFFRIQPNFIKLFLYKIIK